MNNPPRCFNSLKDFRLWQLQRNASKVNDSEYCADCTPKYQARMIAEGRCAFPGTTFSRDAHGELHGTRPGCGSSVGGPGKRKEDTADGLSPASA